MANNSYLINGDFNQTISPLDRGFAYGDGVFRTFRVKGGAPTDWHLHYQKLVADCAAIGIVCPSADVFIEDIEKLFIDDVIDNITSVAKIIITRGEGERGYVTPAIISPLRVIIKSPLPHYHQHYFIEGVELTVCETKLNAQKQLAGVKHLNRIDNVMARMEWRDDVIFDGIMLDHNEQVIECTMCNIFARFNDTLVTPSLKHCGVSGVTRQRILALSTSLDLTVKESSFTLEELYTANEVIICNSLFGALQINKVLAHGWSSQPLAQTLRTLMKYD